MDRFDSENPPPHPAYDERGVDRAQIRAMLELTPWERIARLEAMIASILEIRALNPRPPLR